MVIGVIGAYFSIKLVTGVKKGSQKHLAGWIIYQRVAILHQTYIYFIILNIVDESTDMQSVVMLFVFVAIIHIFYEFFILVAIMKMQIAVNELKKSGNQQIQASPSEVDKLPSYNEVV